MDKQTERNTREHFIALACKAFRDTNYEAFHKSLEMNAHTDKIGPIVAH